MNVRLYAKLFVVLFSSFFAIKFFYLVDGNVINNYPFISPDGFDWYTEGVYLTQLIKGVSLPELPVLRPPLFVFLTALDYISGKQGLVLAASYGVAILFTFFCSVKIVDSVYELPEKNAWYILPLAICTTIYPINYFKPFLLADSLAVALSLASVLMLIRYLKSLQSYTLVISCALAVLAGLTQTYGLIPFLIFSSCNFFLLFRSHKIEALKFLFSILAVSITFIMLTALWRTLLPHASTPQNFALLRFSVDMFYYYLSTWSYYFSPLILFYFICCSYEFSAISAKGILISLVIVTFLFSTLAFFYQWPDARFTFYILPWLMILFFSITRLTSARGSYLIAILTFFLIFLVPESYWSPTWASVHGSVKRNWVSDYFLALPVDRKLHSCGNSCLDDNEFLKNSDYYVNSTISTLYKIKGLK